MAVRQEKVDINMNGNKVTNVADPSANGDAVNLGYIINYVNGRVYKDPARVASTANLTLTAPGASIDGVTMVSGDRVLVKNQSTGADNGIYVWNGASATMTRSTDADTSAEVKSGMTVPVNEGTAGGDKDWFLSTDGTITLGTTALTFINLNAGGTTYTAGNGLALTSTTFSVQANGTSLDVSSSGVKIASAAAGNGLVESAGVLAVNTGTGLTITTDAVVPDFTLVARFKSALAGNGSATTLTLTHNLGNIYHTAEAQDASTGEVYGCQIIKGTNATTFTFTSAPSTNAIALVVVG